MQSRSFVGFSYGCFLNSAMPCLGEFYVIRFKKYIFLKKITKCSKESPGGYGA